MSSKKNLLCSKTVRFVNEPTICRFTLVQNFSQDPPTNDSCRGNFWRRWVHFARSFILAVRWTSNQPGGGGLFNWLHEKKTHQPVVIGLGSLWHNRLVLTGRTAAGETGRIIFGFFSSSWVLFLSERCLLFCHYKICIYFKTLCLSWRGGATERCTFIFWTKFAFVGQLAQKVGAKSGTLWGHKYTNTITLGRWAQFYSMFFFIYFGCCIVSRGSGNTLCSVETVVDIHRRCRRRRRKKYFKNGSRPSNQVMNTKK